MSTEMEISKAAKACQEAFKICMSIPIISELDWFDNRLADFNLWVVGFEATSSGKNSLTAVCETTEN